MMSAGCGKLWGLRRRCCFDPLTSSGQGFGSCPPVGVVDVAEAAAVVAGMTSFLVGKYKLATARCAACLSRTCAARWLGSSMGGS